MKDMFFPDITFAEFFRKWMSGRELPYGDYFDAMLANWRHREAGNCTIVTYENMATHLRECIVEIATFLGKPHVDRLYERCPNGMGSDTLLDCIIEASSIENMKRIAGESDRHYRKGIVGDWRAVMSRDESDLIDKRVEEVWKGTGLELLWERDMKW